MTGPRAIPTEAGGGRIDRSSDRELFATLYEGLRRFAAVVGSAETEPDDLVQEAVARALAGGSLGRFDSPNAYLRRAIVNAASNARRSAGRRRRALVRLQGDLIDGQPAVYPSDLADLGALTPDVRAVIYLHEVEGLGYNEIASLLGLNAASARMAASRALRSLRSSQINGSGKDPS